MYAIWKYFSKEAREAAASSTYFYPSSLTRDPRDKQGRCPLANGLIIDDPLYLYRTRINRQRPDPMNIVNLLQEINQITREERALVIRLAERFVQDWDGGKIDDIWRAVGLKKKEQS